MRETEPTQITQGDRIEWTRTFPDYPATEYTLAYFFRGNGTGFNVAATADGDEFEAAITAIQSAACAIEEYQWQARLTEIADATNTFVIDQGRTNVLRGFVSGTTTAVDLRSDAKIALDTINAALLAFATSDVHEYEIATPVGSRKVKRSDKAQLLEMKRQFVITVRREMLAERMKQGGTLMTPVNVRINQ